MKTEAYNRYACRMLLALLSLAVMQGCAKDGNDLRTGGDEVMVRVEVDARGGAMTRGMSDGDENTVSTIDVYHFVKQSDGKYRSEDHDPAQGTFTEGPPSWINASLHTYPGRDSRLVMVVNARRADNYGYGPTVELDAFLAGLVLEETGEWYNGTTRYLPMYAITGDVEIKEGIPNGEIDNGGNPFPLIRMHAKFNIRLKQPLDAGTFQLASVCVFNRKTQGFIAYDPAKLDNTVPTNPKATSPHIPSTTGNVYLPTAPYYGVGTNISDPDYGMIVNKQYLFEVDNASQSDRLDKTALVIGGRYGADVNVTYYRVDIDATGGNILRNRHYDVEIQSVAGSGYDTAEEAFLGTKRIDAKITDWAIGGNLVSDPGTQRYLWLSDLEFYVEPDGKTFTMTIETNATAWKAVVSSSATNPNAGGATWLTVSPASGGAGTHTLTITAVDNDELVLRNGYIHIKADGRLDAVVKVGQTFKFDLDQITTTPISYGYVGAFWRKDQTGERLIRIHRSMNLTAIDGTWTATVVEGSDWIVLDTEETNDGNIYTEYVADMIQNDATYHVNSTLTAVSGNAGTTDDIYFRIGLKSKWSDDPSYDKDNNPARYGVILLEYNNNSKKHLIFVRQGEDADYLMRPEDPTENNTLTANAQGIYRPLAAKWLPYNLTAAGYRDGASTAEFIQLPQRLPTANPTSGGGVFTNYPSQAGAYFQWANATTIRYAWNPYSSTVSGWNTSYPTTYWNTLGGTNETCPIGYRRPTDGAINAAVSSPAIAASEMRQSLWLNPQISATSNTANSLDGYYADGFFDRRAIVTSTGISNTQANSAVATGTAGVAYRGTLLYNPYTYNSLFIPWAGYRYASSGDLYGPGYSGYYCSSSAYSATHGWLLDVNASFVRQYDHVRNIGFSWRCVQE